MKQNDSKKKSARYHDTEFNFLPKKLHLSWLTVHSFTHLGFAMLIKLMADARAELEQAFAQQQVLASYCGDN